MNILVIGQNGREHALAEAYAKSKRVKKVIMTPGNGLTDFRNNKIKNYPDVKMMDFEGIIEVCKKEKVDLVDVGQDDIIAAGYVERFEDLKIPAFGPTKKASQLEWDKQWARNFMVKYKLPIPKFKSFNNQKAAIDYVKKLPDQLLFTPEGRNLFIKASGLALGKGVIKATNRTEAISAIKQMKEFGKAGETFLIEEGLVGEEFSLFALSDGINYKIISWAQDHKTIYDGDQGPNTGGVGSVAPAGVVTKEILTEVETKIIARVISGMLKIKRPYKGVLYLGAMLTNSGVKILEFNSRWGDPEAEVILPGIKTDYLDIAEAVLSKKLNKLSIEVDKKIRISVAGCSRGYPGDYSVVKGKEIFGLEKAMKLPGITIFGSGIKREKNRFFVNGGRVFYVVAEEKDIFKASELAYQAMNMISIEGNNLHYRTDIGWRDKERMKK